MNHKHFEAEWMALADRFPVEYGAWLALNMTQVFGAWLDYRAEHPDGYDHNEFQRMVFALNNLELFGRTA